MRVIQMRIASSAHTLPTAQHLYRPLLRPWLARIHRRIHAVLEFQHNEVPLLHDGRPKCPGITEGSRRRHRGHVGSSCTTVEHAQPKLAKGLSKLHVQVMHAIRTRNLMSPGENILVAVSGGQDSVCLAQVMADLARVRGWQLQVAHCDHRWRKDSADNAAHVAGLAALWGLPFHLRTAPDPPPTTEAQARAWRYQALTELATELGCGAVLTGHTATDRAETLLFNVVRGAGADGMQALAWMRPLTAGLSLVRPLLSVGRQQTGEFCQRHKLPIWEDSTNSDNKYRRNRIRNELMPYLREHFNPKADETLARTAEVLQDEVLLLEKLAAELLQQAQQRAQALKPGRQRAPGVLAGKHTPRTYDSAVADPSNQQPVGGEQLHYMNNRLAAAGECSMQEQQVEPGPGVQEHGEAAADAASKQCRGEAAASSLLNSGESPGCGSILMSGSGTDAFSSYGALPSASPSSQLQPPSAGATSDTGQHQVSIQGYGHNTTGHLPLYITTEHHQNSLSSNSTTFRGSDSGGCETLLPHNVTTVAAATAGPGRSTSDQLHGTSGTTGLPGSETEEAAAAASSPMVLMVCRSTLASAPVALQRRALRQLMCQLVPDVAVTHGTISEVMLLVASSAAVPGPASTGSLARGIRARLEGQLLIVEASS